MIREFSYEVMTAFVYVQIVLTAVIFGLYVVSVAKVPSEYRSKFIKMFSKGDKGWFYWLPLTVLVAYGWCHLQGYTIADMGRMENMFVDLVAVFAMVFGGIPSGLLSIAKASRLKQGRRHASTSGIVRVGHGPDPRTMDKVTLDAALAAKMQEHNCDRATAMGLLMNPQYPTPEKLRQAMVLTKMVAAYSASQERSKD
ncbi:hypothetical protein [Burkholderia gladioli]|uniref:hypothetical protein n=1 Tax=Burkholderia gladioli TaxID=28095 RepID=UPI001906AE5D|nr:hypothetical protein [Burkholderia gladioli]MBJ9659100.1 hypothetical protein [Burkholderia gladioli]